MESIGSYIKREREFRQISIEEIAAATRVTHDCIEAMERDAFGELPAVTFVRGYLKAYAEHVGLDVADVLLRYEQWLNQEDATGDTETISREPKRKWRWKWKYFWVATVVGVILVLAAYLSRL